MSRTGTTFPVYFYHNIVNSCSVIEWPTVWSVGLGLDCLTLKVKALLSFQVRGSQPQSTKFHSLPKKSRRKKCVCQLHGTVEHNRDLHYRHAPKYCHEPFLRFIRSDLGYCASHCGRYCHLPSVIREGWTTLTSSCVILHVICILIIYSSRFWSSVASSWSDLVTERCT